MTSRTLGSLILAGVPDFTRALCLPGASAVVQRVWDGDGSQEELAEAASTCRACPVLEQCGAWLGSLRPYRRPSGIVAGKRLIPRGETVVYAVRQPPVPHVTVQAGLATAVASAGDPVPGTRGSDRREYMRAYYLAHRAEILARVKAGARPRPRELQRRYNAAYRARHQQEINARQRGRRRKAG